MPVKVEARLKKYAPNVLKMLESSKSEMVTVYHGAEVAPEMLNPIMVTTHANSNSYFVADKSEIDTAISYMSGKVNSFYSLFESDVALSKIKEGHEYYGFLMEFKMPEQYRNDWNVDNRFFVNDLLLATRIGAIDLKKVAAVKKIERENYQDYIKWFEPIEFLTMFFPDKYIKQLLSIKRSASKPMNDYERFQKYHKSYMHSKGVFEIKELVHFETQESFYGYGDRDVSGLVYRDRNGVSRTYDLMIRRNKKNENSVKAKIKFKNKFYNLESKMLGVSNSSLYLDFQGKRIRLAKEYEPAQEDYLLDEHMLFKPFKKSKKASYSFDESGVLVIHLK